MRAPVIALCAANLLLIAALPRIFFKPGRLNAAWWLTAAPFALSGFAVCAAAVGLIEPLPLPSGAATVLMTFAALLASASMALIAYTLGTHTRPVSLWHQEQDSPSALVTCGAYARVRHPFYAAFMLTLGACLATAPHVLTLVALAFGVVRLWHTAIREEIRLLAAFGQEYADYVARTARFLPAPQIGETRARARARAHAFTEPGA